MCTLPSVTILKLSSVILHIFPPTRLTPATDKAPPFFPTLSIHCIVWASIQWHTVLFCLKTKSYLLALYLSSCSLFVPSRRRSLSGVSRFSCHSISLQLHHACHFIIQVVSRLSSFFCSKAVHQRDACSEENTGLRGWGGHGSGPCSQPGACCGWLDGEFLTHDHTNKKTHHTRLIILYHLV